jgi:hypothetical protein
MDAILFGSIFNTDKLNFKLAVQLGETAAVLLTPSFNN